MAYTLVVMAYTLVVMAFHPSSDGLHPSSLMVSEPAKPATGLPPSPRWPLCPSSGCEPGDARLHQENLRSARAAEPSDRDPSDRGGDRNPKACVFGTKNINIGSKEIPRC